MKYLATMIALLLFISCNNASNNSAGTNTASTDQVNGGGGQSTVQDDVSGKDIVKIAVGSKDHTTLVAALQAADYVNAISNAGPFTVFAPTNAAFDALPKGTVEDLLKPENKDKLRSVLEYHVYVGVLKDALLADGMTYEMVSGEKITIGNKDGKITVNGANVIASIPATNGIVHVVDKVLLAPAK